jgi:hypothetical protein
MPNKDSPSKEIAFTSVGHSGGRSEDNLFARMLLQSMASILPYAAQKFALTDCERSACAWS